MTTATVPQHISALEKANQRRMAAARLRRSIAALPSQEGMRKVADYLENPDEVVGSLRVEWLLRSIWYFGEDKAGKICRQSLTSQRRTRRVRDLSERERNVLAANLRLAARQWRSKKSLAPSSKSSTGLLSEFKRGQDLEQGAA